MITFMVAEKPSLAQSISKILSQGKMHIKKCPYNACSRFEWQGCLKGQNTTFSMTSVLGHVMSLDFQSQYNDWDKTDPEELFTADTRKLEATAKNKIPQYLSQEAKGATKLILWLDCDREGENICFEVIDCVYHVMNNKSRDFEILRARFSAITEQEIFQALNHLTTPNENESLSVEARQELDLRVGCAFTRFQTKFFQGKYGNLDSRLISYGPCQTPTLGFCVARHDAIQCFKPQPYWRVFVSISVGTGKRTVVPLQWVRENQFDKGKAQAYLNIIKKQKFAKVTAVTRKEKVKSRPGALNTVEMLRAASSGLGMGPQHTMSVAEFLYIQGYISYPRTETTRYPDSFNLKETLGHQRHHPQWGSIAEEILREGFQRPKKGVDKGDHPPITPMRCVTGASELSGDKLVLYDFITKNFLASLMKDCRYYLNKVHFQVGSETFTCSSKEVIDPGFTALLTWQQISTTSLQQRNINNEDDEDNDDVGLLSASALTKDSCHDLAECKLSEGETQAPNYLTESELISLMEHHGIGTDASIPVHIQNICDRNYVTLIGSRRLQPTNLGVVLCHGYMKIDRDLVQPQTRSNMERELNQIADGSASYKQMLSKNTQLFQGKFQQFVKNIAGMDELFEACFTTLAESGKALSRCGKCKRYMKLITSRPQRLYCVICSETLNLPVGGSVRVYKDALCPLDQYGVVLWTEGGQGKAFTLCPYCYNNPPFEDMTKQDACNKCTHISCSLAMNQIFVRHCEECGDARGRLVLDDSTKPKYKIQCNTCKLVISASKDIKNIQIHQKEFCPDCTAHIVSLKFLESKPLPDGSMEFKGCIFCEDGIESKYFKASFATRRRPNYSASVGGGGRGRFKKNFRASRHSKYSDDEIEYIDEEASYYLRGSNAPNISIRRSGGDRRRGSNRGGSVRNFRRGGRGSCNSDFDQSNIVEVAERVSSSATATSHRGDRGGGRRRNNLRNFRSY